MRLAAAYPGDPGAVTSVLLNPVTLNRGEALFIPAGTVHAYLQGVGVEIMANSDNVLRGGLTSKHVDVAELLRVLDFTPRTPPVLRGAPEGGWVRYDTDAVEFVLRRFESPAEADVAVPDGGPRILLCTAGSALVRATGGAERVLGRGQALWLAAGDRDVTVVCTFHSSHDC